MAGKKPLKERLKQDLAIILVLMLFAGGSLGAFAGNPMFLPLAALLLLAMLGPYAWEFLSERRSKAGPERKKLLVNGIVGDDGKKSVSCERKG